MIKKDMYYIAMIALSLLSFLAWADKDAVERHLYYGDLHLHTNDSLDSFILNGPTLEPRDAYRFARGERVDYGGRSIQRNRALDFIAVTDHSENLGLSSQLADSQSQVFKTNIGRIWADKGPFQFWAAIVELISAGKSVPEIPLERFLADAWEQGVKAANEAYVPGRFTTFIGFEWTSFPAGQNLHRNIIFRDEKPPQPFSSYESQRPEDLWAWLDEIRQDGYEAIAIPHNSNVSNGLMYDWLNSDEKQIDTAYAETRIRNEPLSEIVQGKGQSETHPSLSHGDQFADFEIFPHLLASNIVGKVSGSYIREAWGRGLVLAERIGINPYQFGVVGGTDFHNGVSTEAEDAYSGDMIGTDPNAEGFTMEQVIQRLQPGNRSSGGVERLETAGGAITGAWAEENTRSSIYAALRRRETFATSGPRIQVRFFAGWSFSSDILERQQWVGEAYRDGIPMGGELRAVPSDHVVSPEFLVWAAKESDGTQLDRIQIVKVWIKNGEPKEKVFDVRVSLPSSNGAAELVALWHDPEFQSRHAALYYARVIEVPTLRWSARLAQRHNVPQPPGVPTYIQERAWTSPIWYTPQLQ
ncbi:MAG: DUF3604 domain-containing protein [Pseudomonadales bacterium]|jgi:hypothetical protein|nr:DUF3604 domain-containing protein [Pseudomonadales bacterium]MCP5336855.1 DUF3604 domain-containing protein [Pseudomonadales bacterium]